MSALPLFEVAWKAALVAGLVLTAAALLRARPAGERVALLRLGVVVVLAVPLLTALPALRVAAPAAMAGLEPAPGAVAVAEPLASSPLEPAPALRDATVSPAPPPAVAALPALDPLVVVAAIYGLGASLLLARLALGVGALAGWTRSGRPVADPRWLAALERAADSGRRPRLVASAQVTTPLSWGVLPGVILVDDRALAQPERADAVLAHEMAHVRHGDWLFLMLSQVLVALFWFNPLMWLLQRELARQSERAADAWAVRRVPRADYADALVALARSGRPLAALGMASSGSDLGRRIAAVLSGPASRGRPWQTAVAALACVGLASPLAALELAPAVVPAAPSPAPVAASHPAAPIAAAAGPAAAAAGITRALAPASAAALAEPPSPERLATVERQRGQSLAFMEVGARAMEASARQVRQQADHLPMEPSERAQLMREADALEAEARQLRREARDLAARAPAALTPLSADAERELAAGLATLRSAPMPAGMAADIDPRAIEADLARVPPPEALAAEIQAAQAAVLSAQAELASQRSQAESARAQAAAGPP